MGHIVGMPTSRVFGGGGGGGTSNILAAQVLDFQQEESIADVGATPDVLEIEVFE